MHQIIVSYDSRYCKRKLHDTSRGSLGLVLCYTLQHTATHCDTLRHTATHSYPLISGAASDLSFATHCNTHECNTHECSAMLPSPHAPEVVSGVASCSCSGLLQCVTVCCGHRFAYNKCIAGACIVWGIAHSGRTGRQEKVNMVVYLQKLHMYMDTYTYEYTYMRM